jgi:hypothetical protein
MTVNQLIDRLKKLRDNSGAGNMEVCIQELQSEFSFSEVQDVLIKKIDFKEDPCGKTLCSEDCVVLTDEF